MTPLLVENALVIGMTRPGDVVPDGALFVEGGMIAARDAEAHTRARAYAAAGRPVERLNARGMWVLPGFVQTHVHLCQTLLRNGPDDLALLPWLSTHVWPGEAAHDGATLEVSARLGLAELLAGGTTSILDMGTVHHTARSSAPRPRRACASRAATPSWTTPGRIPRGSSARRARRSPRRTASRRPGTA
jgi:5-methylthioadenosine/S-adenosylhomocysteine deaminase